ncbi:cupredoxin [Purpureocillium lavendulum]|uniref:Cupredoxin n=1 Tax=Purpureocillium lavendulum TaxID=1247861 RepID=A0AB34FQY0_9HYPO|nr:cupredoxin [Purpureocillium lavendulum]
MKFSTSLSLALAPLALGRRVRDVFSPPSEPELVVKDTGADALDERGVTIVSGKGGKSVNVNSRTEVIIIWANPGGGAPTTTINQQVTVTKTVTAGNGGLETRPAGAQATHTIKVGGPGGLTYQPVDTKAAIGDMVIVEFYSQNHTFTQSTFAKPCAKLEGGLDSGFLANPNNTIVPAPKLAFQVNTTEAIWFYCRQGAASPQTSHCGKGMVGSVNGGEKVSEFQAQAIAQNGTGQAAPITGGNGSNNPAKDPAGTASTSASAPEATGGNGGGGNNNNNNNNGGNNGSVTPGQGTVNPDGSCSCVVTCSSGSFPAQNQGVGSFGGMGGSLPLNMVSMK